MKIVMILVVLLVVLLVGGVYIHGLLLGFQSGLLVGVIHLLIPPLSLITGGVEIASGQDISVQIAKIIANISN